MRDSYLRIKNVLPGVHRVKSKLARGRIAAYWYAWRGGPQIFYCVAESEADLQARIADELPDIKARFKQHVSPAANKAYLSGLIALYLGAKDDGLDQALQLPPGRRLPGRRPVAGLS